jgi:hypothetical protein
MKMAAPILLLCAFAGAALAGDLTAIKAETNLERRSDRALENADRSITVARDAYNAGKMSETKAALAETAESVQLSYESLVDTGKHPRQSPKHFKRAEVKVREMLRRLKNLESDFSVDDRGAVAQTEQRLQQIHDDLLNGIMSKKKR